VSNTLGQGFHKTRNATEGGFVQTTDSAESNREIEPQGSPPTAPTGATSTGRRVGERPSLWWSTLLAFVGLLLFIGIFNFLLPDLGANLNEGGLIALGLIFSLVPALLWLAIFYRVDRREPEPKQMVIAVYLVGLLLTAAIYQPIVQGLFMADEWMYETWWGQLLGEVLLVGGLSMGIVYLAVRVVVYGSHEFDERLDGIIYCMAAALGLATVVNFSYVLDHGGVDLGIGSIRMVTNALGYAGFGAVLGYFVGQARFEKTPAYYLPAGVGLAALLTGLYFFLLDRTASDPFGSFGWRDLLLAAFLTLLVLAFAAYLVRRTDEETARVAGLNSAGDAWVRLAPVATVTGVMEATGAGKDIEEEALRREAAHELAGAPANESAAESAATSQENVP
jgi:RsiW-degrading membrane proteinase PrsW (M82 family)